MNSLKFKPEEDAHPAKNVKKPGRAEDNHFTSLPNGDTPESLEKERISLLVELQKKNNLKNNHRKDGNDVLDTGDKK